MTSSTATSSRRPVIAGNWKMFKTIPEATVFVEGLASRIRENLQTHPENILPEIILCPSFTTLYPLQKAIMPLQSPFEWFSLAGQTMDDHDNGAYTGEISPVMLVDLGIHRVVLGHSERRQYFNETSDSVARKTVAAFSHDITPIICVGESLEERNSGQTDQVIAKQLKPVLEKVSSEDIPRMMVAYEPVWAIGTGKVCEPDEANRVCSFIRGLLNQAGSGQQTRILYGGSVKPDNTLQLMRQSDIDGALIGGASLSIDSFMDIVQQTGIVYAH